MKQFHLALALSLLLLLQPCLAQVELYRTEVELSERVASVKALLRFAEPTSFELIIPARARSFEANETICDLKLNGITLLRCEEAERLEFRYETQDFIQEANGRFFFDADFTLGRYVGSAVVYIKLEEGILLADEPDLFPKDVSIGSDGRRVVLFWKRDDVQADQALKFRFFYESLRPAPVLHLVSIPIALVFGLFCLLVYRLRRERQLMFSMLNRDEQAVLDVVLREGGKTKQRKVVRETGMSKAKVSRIVKALAQRGILEVQRTGRVNRLRLRKRLGVF
jgi:hypothetical protein